MTAQIVKVKPFSIMALLDYEGIQEPNQHGKVKLTALINREKEVEYREKALKSTWVEVQIIDELGKEELLFCGVLICMRIKKESHECIMELELATGTILLENEEHIRSFQAENLTYKHIINAVNSKYDDAATIMTVGKGETLLHFTLQYNVNDWEFLRRMCALNNSVLVPSYIGPGIKYFFGMPKLNDKATFDTEYFSMINGEDVSYVVKSREIYRVGTNVNFLGFALIIWKVESKLEGSELYHTYYMSRDIRKLVRDTDRYDKDIIGASLFGKVTDVKDEVVRISISSDENNDNCGERWFPFSTVYSSDTGAGWYCMPELGDKIRLYLPTSNEGDAYVCSAVHENEGGGIRLNPDHKIWRNKYGKEIRMTPDSILLTNNKGNSVELSDANGICIKSSGSVDVKAEGRIRINSKNSGIEMTASNRIRFQQGEAELLMQNGVKVTGTKVNIM